MKAVGFLDMMNLITRALKNFINIDGGHTLAK